MVGRRARPRAGPASRETAPPWLALMAGARAASEVRIDKPSMVTAKHALRDIKPWRRQRDFPKKEKYLTAMPTNLLLADLSSIV